MENMYLHPGECRLRIAEQFLEGKTLVLPFFICNPIEYPISNVFGGMSGSF